MTDQSRGHWTSASSAEADSLCPARHLRQRGIAEQPSADSESGTRVHQWLAGSKSIKMNGEEVDVALRALEIEQEAIKEHLGITYTFNQLRMSVMPGLIFREHRFWMEFPNGGLKHSGQVDLLVVNGNRGFLSERKSLWGQHAESSKNLQVRDQVVLAIAELPKLEEVVAIVNQPRLTRNPEATLYTLEDWGKALEQMQKRVTASNDPNAKASPGELQCKFCKAKSICPEFLAAGLPVVQVQNGRINVPEIFIADALARLSGDQLGKLLPMARLFAEAAEFEVRSRLNAGQTVDGWHFAPGRTTEKITDPQTVFSRFIANGGKPESFMSAVTVGKGKLKEAVRSTHGVSGKALDAEMDRMLDGATESKTSQPVLERVNVQ